MWTKPPQQSKNNHKVHIGNSKFESSEYFLREYLR